MRKIPEHMRQFDWYAKHQAWMKLVGWPHFDDPGDAAPTRADLTGADLRDADLRDADLTGAAPVIPGIDAAIVAAGGTVAMDHPERSNAVAQGVCP